MTGIVFAIVVFLWLLGLMIYAVNSRRRVVDLEGHLAEVRGALELHKAKSREHLRQIEEALENGVRGLVLKEIRNLLRKH